ncbi:hypothetical protein [Amycolatopsis xylanica]|uniref:hypothetical protein n=1 Tax=Amycolatopsis xylanica TaxID=589385 RepID=UPI000B8063A9|nr:hypothetical protein [Amycolatopsis xylanica]
MTNSRTNDYLAEARLQHQKAVEEHARIAALLRRQVTALERQRATLREQAVRLGLDVTRFTSTPLDTGTSAHRLAACGEWTCEMLSESAYLRGQRQLFDDPARTPRHWQPE